MCVINEFNENTCKKLLSVKSNDWRGENECRAIYVLKADDISVLSDDVYFDTEKQSEDNLYKLHGHVQTNNLRTLSAKKFILKKCEPSVIYLGLRMDWKDKKRLINIARKYNIKVYQMSQERNSFKFVPQEINTYFDFD